MVDDARLERRHLLDEQRVLAEVSEHAEVILGLALVVLLEAGLSGTRVGGHQDPGLRAVAS